MCRSVDALLWQMVNGPDSILYTDTSHICEHVSHGHGMLCITAAFKECHLPNQHTDAMKERNGETDGATTVTYSLSNSCTRPLQNGWHRPSTSWQGDWKAIASVHNWLLAANQKLFFTADKYLAWMPRWSLHSTLHLHSALRSNLPFVLPTVRCFLTVNLFLKIARRPICYKKCIFPFFSKKNRRIARKILKNAFH